jgi:hypothetical protein
VKLVVPYIGELQPADAGLVKLTEFLGIECEMLPLAKPVNHFATYLESAVSDRRSCFAINPGVLKEWVEADRLPPELSSFLTSHFRRLFIHAVGQESFDQDLVAALSGGDLSGVRDIRNLEASYDISPDSRDICEAFAGLSVGPANPNNDRVFSGHNGPAVRRLISIDGDAFMAIVSRGECEIIFIGSEDVADLDTEVDGAWIAEYFSRFLPHAMALRHIFGEECWRTSEQFASVIVDDPLLRLNYGFLNFESLLDLMTRHNFQTTIAFIPHNFRRSSARITRIFRENATRFALCFHGNDHTGAEFAATDKVLLNTMLHTAERRMKLHGELTKLHCDRVMVFPQGQFSIEAMAALRSSNFEAAVNTVPHPRQQQVNLTLAELARPAVLRYAGFPLFLRKNSVRTQTLDIAFNLFFGKPILIVEHHNIFEEPQPLIDAINRINAAAPEIRWSDLGTALSGSILNRREPDGTCRVLASARTIRVSNTTESLRHFTIEWNQLEDAARVENVLRNEFAYDGFQIEEKTVRVSAELEPGRSEIFSLVFRSSDASVSKFGLRHSARAFVRRRLSEIRDNYLSKNPSVLAATKTLQRRLQR